MRQRWMRSLSCGVCVVILTLGAWTTANAAGYPFSDDFESGLASWDADAPWGTTTAFYASPVSSATDSPSTFYGTSVDAALSLATSLDLTAATAPVLRFYHRHQLEDGHDFGYVETSTDGGASWSAPLATYTGGLAIWSREQIDLSAVAGYNDVRIRFRLVTDGTVVQDGWYLDDVLIAEAPAAVALTTPSTITPNSVDLSWSASTEPGFTTYRIYRGTSSGFDWRDATLVDEITGIGTSTHTDITVVPKTTYYYKIMVVTSDELHSLSNEESAATPAGMDYPFLDNGEGGGSAWTADPPWALSSEAAFSGSHAWSDSPGGLYGDEISSQALTLVGPIDLTSASAPVLSFVHTWEFLSGDSGHVEISTDGGSSWTDLQAFTNGNSNGWLRERFELDTYTSSNNVFVRFRITTDSANTADGWHVDDISVAESPTVVDPPILSDVTSHSIRLTWSRCNDLLFSHYAIYRSSTTGVGIQDTLVTEIHDQDTTTFSDTGLAFDADYFYRVYAVSPYGTLSPDSSAESSAHTGGNPYPFSDDFEGSLESWYLEGDWAKTDTDQHGGSWSLTDTPGTTYPTSANSSAWTTIDLRGSTRPVLSFWDRFALADTGDWARVELSTNGTSWTRVYSATLTGSGWAQQQIDLSPWKNEASLRIRFLLSSNYSGILDGWYVDDLVIDEDPSGPAALGFSDGFELGDGNWLGSAWALTGDSPHSGSACMQSTPQGKLLDGTTHALELAGSFNLSTAIDPQLVYWIRGLAAYRGYFNVESSIDGGQTWVGLPGASVGHSVSIPDWTRYQISLAGVLADDVRIRFTARQTSGFTYDTNMYLDDVVIEEMPQPVYLNPLTPHLKSIDLSWAPSTLSDFNHYEVYRSTTANVTTANDLVFSSATSTDTSFTDSGLSIGATYYYRVFVFNDLNVATPSNERSATTVPLTVPFTDPMEDLTNWDATGDWGPDSVTFHGGSAALNDSPGSSSPTGSTTYILTAINLTGTSWPVLRFWDRHGLADDWGYLEVSPNGSTWYRLYTASGARSAWAEQAVDLSPWKTADNLRIRFTVATGGSVSDDGWYIDDLSITNHTVSQLLPFFDDAESGTDFWLPTAWAQDPSLPHSGSASFRSTPSGLLLASGQHTLELAGELDLSAAEDPQLVYWLRGTVADDGGFAAQISTNGGVTWGTLPGGSIGQNNTVPNWTRYQI
ncbi:MAG: hypothetical protein V2I67_13155, partial [Thermoanaerobaculales bacterium]|nr:hypothetical protein [Thermoanaerobaculales bacterium]